MNSTLTKESTKTKIFQETESACWETCHCPSMIKNECPATKYTYLPCWEIEGTYCKLNDYGAKGNDVSICEVCRVYKKYGHGEPIKLKLLERGINSKLENLTK